MRRILRAASWVFLGVLLGRIAGFCRDLILASSYGHTSKADVITLILSVPDMLLNLLVGGAMAAALIPEFARLGPRKAWILYNQSLKVILLIFFGLAFVWALFPRLLIYIFGPGLAPSVTDQALLPAQIVVFTVPLTAAAAITSAYLNYRERFAVASLSTAMYNVAIVTGMIIVARTGVISYIAIAAIAGAIFSLVVQEYTARKVVPPDHEPEPNEQKVNYFNRALAIRYVQALAAGSLIYVLPLIGRSMASFQGNGSVAILNYTIKLVELPLGVVLTIFSVALLPYLSRCFSEGNLAEAEKLSTDGVRVITLVAFGIAVAILFGSYPIVNLLYGHGKMDATGVATISGLWKIGIIGLVPQAIITVQLAVLNSRLDTKSPFYATAFGLVAFLAATAILTPLLGLPGISWSFVSAYWVIAATLFIVLARKHSMHIARSLFTPRLALALLAVACVGVPLGFLTLKLENHALIAVPLVILSAILAPFAGLLTLEPYRSKIFRRFSRVEA